MTTVGGRFDLGLIVLLCPRLLNVAATFRDRGVDGELAWAINMA